jgi:hypothetical protein
MSQPAIRLESQHMYHIRAHANGNENLFRSIENYHYYLKKYFRRYFGLDRCGLKKGAEGKLYIQINLNGCPFIIF